MYKRVWLLGAKNFVNIHPGYLKYVHMFLTLQLIFVVVYASISLPLQNSNTILYFLRCLEDETFFVWSWICFIIAASYKQSNPYLTSNDIIARDGRWKLFWMTSYLVVFFRSFMIIPFFWCSHCNIQLVVNHWKCYFILMIQWQMLKHPLLILGSTFIGIII